jgi:hypothetical protein
LKKEKWLNEGFAVSLDSKEADYLANYTEEELKQKGIPLTSIVIAVSIELINMVLEKTGKEVCEDGRSKP